MYATPNTLPFYQIIFQVYNKAGDIQSNDLKILDILREPTSSIFLSTTTKLRRLVLNPLSLPFSFVNMN